MRSQLRRLLRVSSAYKNKSIVTRWNYDTYTFSVVLSGDAARVLKAERLAPCTGGHYMRCYSLQLILLRRPLKTMRGMPKRSMKWKIRYEEKCVDEHTLVEYYQ